MKKKTFLEGAVISSIGIILCKILGLIYVIPFYSIIGTAGGVLYSYGYSVYSTFLNFSNLGIPTAMSKLISEYQALGYNNTKERVYKIGKRIILTLSVLIVIIMLLFSKNIATYIIGGDEGTFSVNEVSQVINFVTLALLIVPLLSITKGYFQGHRFMTESSTSTVLEQLVRVIVLIFGSFLIINVLKMGINLAVSVAMLAASLGALVAYLYLIYKKRKNKEHFNVDAEALEEEKSITTKDIIKQIVIYAFPFVMIELLRTFYSIIDMTTIIGTLKSLYNIELAEKTYSILTTWAPKINMIGLSISSGMIISLIPSISENYIKNDYKGINHKLNQALQTLMYVLIPLTFLLSFLAGPVWSVFYGYDEFATNILTVYVLQIIWGSLYTLLLNLNQAMSKTKTTILVLAVNLGLKLTLNVPMMHLFYKLGFGGYFGTTFANITIYTITFILMLTIFKKKYNFNYMESIKKISILLLHGFFMLGSLYLLNLLIPINYTSRLNALIYLVVYGIIGVVIYFITTYKTKLFDDIFGDKLLNYIKKFLKRGKKNAIKGNN